MTSRTRTASFVAGLMILASSGLLAQARWGQEPVPREGVCFYQDINYRGQYFCLPQGQSLNAMPSGMNDKISSIKVFGRANVIVYKDVRFRGASAQFDTDVRDLRTQGWNDLISSARVSTSSWGGGRPPDWGNAALPREGACFYKDPDFRGQHFCAPRSAGYALVPPGFNDQISSIRIQRSNVMIFVDRDYGGRATRLTSDVANLGRTWSDTISSLRVY